MVGPNDYATKMVKAVNPGVVRTHKLAFFDNHVRQGQFDLAARDLDAIEATSKTLLPELQRAELRLWQKDYVRSLPHLEMYFSGPGPAVWRRTADPITERGWYWFLLVHQKQEAKANEVFATFNHAPKSKSNLARVYACLAVHSNEVGNAQRRDRYVELAKGLDSNMQIEFKTGIRSAVIDAEIKETAPVLDHLVFAADQGI